VADYPGSVDAGSGRIARAALASTRLGRGVRTSKRLRLVRARSQRAVLRRTA